MNMMKTFTVCWRRIVEKGTFMLRLKFFNRTPEFQAFTEVIKHFGHL